MGLKKEKITGVDATISALDAAMDQQALTPVLEATTVTVMGGQRNDLFVARSELKGANDAGAALVISTETAGGDVVSIVKNYIDELNATIRLRGAGSNPKSVRALHGINSRGSYPSMSTEKKKIDVANNIIAGNLLMVSGGHVVNTRFTSAMVFSEKTTFKALIDSKKDADTLIDDKETAVRTKLAPAKATAIDIPRQVKHFYRLLPPSQIREKERLFGSDFIAILLGTDIKVVVKLPGNIVGAGAEIRIGDVLTKAGKPSKAGVKATADMDGEKTLKTTAVDDTYVNVRLINFADAHVAITIVAGVPQRIVVTLVPGVSSLGA